MTIDPHSWKEDIAGHFDADTNKEARVSSAIGYLFFFVPLIMNPDSKFARYHANQSFILLLWNTFGLILASLVPYIGMFLTFIVLGFGIIFLIRGMILALRLEAKHVPVIGKLVVFEFEDSFNISI